MRRIFSAALATVFLFSGLAQADEPKPADDSKPIKLTAEQMDKITAGDLVLPNGRVQFAGFDNPSPAGPASGLFHPSFGRSLTASAQQQANGYSGPAATQPNNEGPWSAAAASPVISCVDSFGYGFGGICPIP